jgi:protocatechuate 3,4-dioxygenase beta subunit
MAGTKLTISGYVLTTDCKPVSGARVDFWQADDNGQYDNSGYRLRGYQLTDASGRYTVETIIPGLYPGRTRHIHVKVNAPNGPVLTTQLFFSGEQQNSRDSIFNQRLVLNVEDAQGGKTAAFDFVVPAT